MDFVDLAYNRLALGNIALQAYAVITNLLGRSIVLVDAGDMLCDHYT